MNWDAFYRHIQLTRLHERLAKLLMERALWTGQPAIRRRKGRNW